MTAHGDLPTLTDTHLHLLYPERFTYDWTGAVEPLARPFPLEAYLQEALGLGITAALHVEVDVAEREIEAETAFISSIVQRPENPVRGLVTACRPEHDGFEASLARLHANPSVRGLRRILHTSPDELSQNQRFVANVGLAGRHGYTFDLCVLAPQLPVAIRLARACPDVQFVLDHAGNPPAASGILEPWARDLRELSMLPNVACKISGLLIHADATRAFTPQLRPFFEHAVECFGWERVVWGSDWPVVRLAATLATWLAVTNELLAGCSTSERERLAWRNAARIYRLSPHDR